MIMRASKVTFLPASSTPAPAPVKYRQLNLDLLGALESSFIICALLRYYGCGRKFLFTVFNAGKWSEKKLKMRGDTGNNGKKIIGYLVTHQTGQQLEVLL